MVLGSLSPYDNSCENIQCLEHNEKKGPIRKRPSDVQLRSGEGNHPHHPDRTLVDPTDEKPRLRNVTHGQQLAKKRSTPPWPT